MDILNIVKNICTVIVIMEIFILAAAFTIAGADDTPEMRQERREIRKQKKKKVPVLCAMTMQPCPHAEPSKSVTGSYPCWKCGCFQGEIESFADRYREDDGNEVR